MKPILIDILFGVLGGVLAELFKHHRFVQETPGPMPDKFKGLYYWIVTIAMMFAGGVLTLAHKLTGAGLNPIIDLNIGASAPLMIGAFIARPPKVD
jgi:hypothetical protein